MTETETELDDPLATVLPQLLERAVPDRRPPVHPLVTGGLARGYRRRRLRRLGQVAGAAAAVVALSLPIGLVAHAVRDRPVAAQPSAPAESTPPASTPSASTPGPLLHTQQGVVDALVALLTPKGTVTRPQSSPVNGDAFGASVQFTDGHGLSLVTAAVWASLASASLPATGDCTPDPGCVTTTLGDGSVAYGRLDRVTTVSPTEVVAIAWLVRPDGSAVSMEAWNAAEAKSLDVTRTAPPFTVAQLVAMVQAPVWLAG